MRSFLRCTKFIVAALTLAVLTLIYFESFSDHKLASNSDVSLLKRFSLIQEDQQKRQTILSKSQNEIDREIVEQLTPKKENGTTINTDIDIREWFDDMSKWNSSAKDPRNHPFFKGFSIANSGLCKDAPVDVLIYVQSSTEHREKRDIIRSTWASTRLLHDVSVKTIFVLGMPVIEDEQILIDMEHSTHGDIVQGMFNDEFNHLALKAITTLVWINGHCPQAKVVLKVDDDVFVDIFRVVSEFIPLMDQDNGLSILCDVVNSSTVVRDPKNKWYVPSKFVPSMTKYPTFCSGYFVLMSGNLIPSLYEESFRTDKYIPVDDAYVFGLLTNGMANVKLKNIHSQISYLERPDPIQELKTNGKFELLAFERPRRMADVWKFKLQHLTDWERSHSLYVKLFETPGKRSVVIE